MAPKKSQDSFPTAAPFLPERLTLPNLQRAAAGCRGCDLFKNATQTVFGEGPSKALVMFVGEQPGRLRRPAGTSVCGTRGAASGRSSGRGGDRPLRGVRHECGEALQVGGCATRQAAHSQEAAPFGNRSVPSVAGCGVESCCSRKFSSALEPVRRRDCWARISG